MENPIKMDDFGVPLFLETPKWTLKILDPIVDIQPRCSQNIGATYLMTWPNHPNAHHPNHPNHPNHLAKETALFSLDSFQSTSGVPLCSDCCYICSLGVLLPQQSSIVCPWPEQTHVTIQTVAPIQVTWKSMKVHSWNSWIVMIGLPIPSEHFLKLFVSDINLATSTSEYHSFFHVHIRSGPLIVHQSVPSPRRWGPSKWSWEALERQDRPPQNHPQNSLFKDYWVIVYQFTKYLGTIL